MEEAHSIEDLSTDLSDRLVDEFDVRPDFVDGERLREQFGCGICADVVLQPQQTSCGKRVCAECIEDKFGNNSVIPCPLSHDEFSEDEICQREGLERNSVHADKVTHKLLLKERCFCGNSRYGCCEEPLWKKLKQHERVCGYVPVRCPYLGCEEKSDYLNLINHKSECGFAKIECSYCELPLLRMDLEEHLQQCEKVDNRCEVCKKQLKNLRQLTVHQKTNPPCLLSAGKCCFYQVCHFEAATVDELRQHMSDERSKSLHLESLTFRVQQLEENEEDPNEVIKAAVNLKLMPLERATGKIAVDVANLRSRVKESETGGESVGNALREMAKSSLNISSVQTGVSDVERQLKEAGLDGVTDMKTRCQDLLRQKQSLRKMEHRIKNAELVSYDGTLVWKIDEYKKRKDDAIAGRQIYIYSHPFYTSKQGYRMCCKAYLNGDGPGKGSNLSLFFVLMNGEYDELLDFPFKQSVTLSLLSPDKPWLNKKETLVPDPDSSSFKRPQTEMNIASGCPQFASHEEVESSPFLVNDCIYVRVQVEPNQEVDNRAVRFNTYLQGPKLI